MDATTVAVAGLGLASTLAAAWLSARWQKRGLVETEILTAQVQAYGDCATALYELERTSYNRAVTRIPKREAGLDIKDEEDDLLAQQVYECNSAARATIGRLSILSGRSNLAVDLETIREDVSHMHDLATREALTHKHKEVMAELKRILDGVRNEFDDFQGR